MTKNSLKKVVIATLRPWNIKQAQLWKPPQGYEGYLITSPEQLTLELLKKLNPRYVFFPHWSTLIPREIYSKYECVVFHETDLPFGRGGSPLQNLIVRGIYETKISALQTEAGLDTGPIYMKRKFSLEHGSALELFRQISEIVFQMISDIILQEPIPSAQVGEPTVFKRRKPEESRIPEDCSGRALYDFIRMLDAPEYPKAFAEYGNNHYEFHDASLMEDGSVHTAVIINNKGISQ